MHQWSQSFGDSGNDQGYALAIDAFSNVYVTGGFWGTVDFGDGDRVSVGFEDIFLARYDPAGGHMLSMRYGGTDFDFGTGIDVDADGNMYLSARFAGNVDFGGGLLTSAGGNDIVLTKYGPGASVFWSQRFGGTGQDGPGAITVDRIGNVVMTGLFSDNVDFGGGTFVGQGNTDAFLAKYGTPLVLPEISSILDIGNDQGGSVRITFDATNKDYPGSSDPVLNYGAYRRIDPVASLTSRVTLEESDPGPYLEGWEFVGSIPANGEPVYNMIVSTLADSSVVSGIQWTGFFIRALTADPYTYFDSPPDSGYSVDNLAPSSPLNLAFVVPGLLAWDHVPDADFDYYTVYGSYSSNFGTSAVEVEFTTGNTSLVGWTPYPYFYVTATDFSGNESDAASPSPPTGIGDKPVALAPALSSHPNPFNPVTTIAFTVTSPGLVTLAVYDVDGELVETLIDREYRITNTYQIQFRPTSASGIYFARLETADWIRSIKLVLLK